MKIINYTIFNYVLPKGNNKIKYIILLISNILNI